MCHSCHQHAVDSLLETNKPQKGNNRKQKHIFNTSQISRDELFPFKAYNARTIICIWHT